MSKYHNEETGLVAIVVSMLIMIIMSLTVFGFTKIMQREQRQAVDKQLSTQAFYAAESGINDAVAKIHDPAVIAAGGLQDKKKCDTSSNVVTNPSGLVGAIDATNNVGYTCLLIDTQLKQSSIPKKK